MSAAVCAVECRGETEGREKAKTIIPGAKSFSGVVPGRL